jgi:hypothetical protein
MGTILLNYTGSEAIDIIKTYYPQDWKKKLESKKTHLIKLSNIHKVSIEKAYRKFIMPRAGQEETIVFFAALSELIKLEKMPTKQKKDRVLELEVKRERVAEQIFALENPSNIISYEDKKILRAHYTQLQQDATAEINELVNSFEVVEPQLIIHQPGLFDAKFNS